ncbi:MAG: hypothetical protein K0S61_2831 [Anaerocolumna sp.]|jgi:hypothetical protein|nr:hypothetical protein [Anaerocolumna sp.]
MKKSFIIGVFVFLLFANIVFVTTTVLYKTKMDKQVFKVYSFEGEGSDIRISDGLVMISPNKQKVSGGKIQYIGSKRENIQSYSKTIYLDKQAGKDVVLSNCVSFAGDNKGTAFPDEFLLNKDMGEISSEKLFSKDAINNIKENLYFSLDYSTIDGKTGNYTIKLNVKEFNMNEFNMNESK